MKKRNVTYGLGCLLLLCVISLLSVAQLRMSRANSAADIKDSMNLAYTLETNPAEIPPIDKAAPAIFETASFGLG